MKKNNVRLMVITAFVFVLAFVAIRMSQNSSGNNAPATEVTENAFAPAAEPKQVVEDFYKDYLANKPNVSMPFSKSFKELAALNSKTCTEKAGTDNCGWDAKGDIYLNAEESDPGLTYENSGIQISEEPGNIIVVKLNVYPSDPARSAQYQREIKIPMIKEDGFWVADDLILGETTARKLAQMEIDRYTEPTAGTASDTK